MTAPLDTSDDRLASGRRPSDPSAFERLVRLQRLTAQLAGAIDAQTVAEVVVDHILFEVGAGSAAMWLVDGDDLVLERSKNVPNDGAASSRRMKISALPGEHPLGQALRSRTNVFLRDRALVCVPLLSGDSALGALTYAFTDDRELDADDRSYLDLLAANVAASLERARLFGAERAARARVEHLYALAAAAARATSLDEIFEPALDIVCRALGVERASILLFDASGSMRFRAWRKLSAEYRHAVDGHSPWSRDAEDPAPIVVHDVTEDATWREYLPVFEKEGIRALAFVPLVHDRRLIGKFMMYCAEPRVFSAEDTRLATAIATHLAQAIARSAAQDETKQARAAAEEAARQRAEMVAVVAHDLRNPLGVAQLKAQLMMRKVPDGPDGEKMKRDLEVIARNTQHMARLIGDLLDAATIEANRIAVEKTPNVVADILGEAADLVRMLADQKGIALEVEASPADALANCDRARVVQVLSNLLGNAIKHTPQNGAVKLSGRAVGPELLLSVEDTGPGIPASERERVFERYVHGRQKGSVGLGLFIARGLVAAHGGRIWIEDGSAGTGTRVCFTLPGA